MDFDELDLKKARLIIERDFDGSRMSTRKWMELLCNLHTIPPFPKRIKVIDHPIPSDWTEEILGGYGSKVRTGHFRRLSATRHVLWIEWLELIPVNEHYDYTDKTIRSLNGLHVPYEIENQIIRIVAHLRRPKPE